ncbi:MAG: hypothetical protein HOP07_11040 [Bacteriovoracaceae bacterium]|nr:hypothetical protein [Bacteriovoracaceae bacterium]
MIQLEVLTSDDQLALGVYEFNFNYIHIGRSKRNDIIISNKELPALFLKISIFEDAHGEHLMVRNRNREPFYQINGKKISGSLKIKTNDIISFGPTSLKIISFQKTPNGLDLTEPFKAFEANAPECRVALDFIEEVLMDLEKQTQNV